MTLHKTEDKCNLKKKKKKNDGTLILIFYRFEIVRKNDINWAPTQAILSSGFAYNEGVDQPSNPHSLISAIAFRFLENLLR